MTISLRSICHENRALLGRRFENLGKKTGVLLSFDGIKGWRIEKFEGICGFFKWILRYFGFYESTHLSTVTNQIFREKDISWRLFNKIRFCWLKKEGRADPIKHPPVDEARVEVNALPGQKAIRFKGDALFTIVKRTSFQELDDVTAIVNATDKQCLGDGSISGAIDDTTKREIHRECLRFPIVNGSVRCPTGEARITDSGNLARRGIQRIIHTAVPTYNLQDPAASGKALQACYTNSLHCLLYTSPSPRDRTRSRMPSSA